MYTYNQNSKNKHIYLLKHIKYTYMYYFYYITNIYIQHRIPKRFDPIYVQYIHTT